MVMLGTSLLPVPKFAPVIKIGVPGATGAAGLPAGNAIPVIDGVTDGAAGLTITAKETEYTQLSERGPAEVWKDVPLLTNKGIAVRGPMFSIRS